jgi:hypothetical protein
LSNPFPLAKLITPALDGIVRAVSGRGNQTEGLAKADAAMNLILAFQPRDVIEMTLAGQTVLFNELLADGAHDALRGTVDGAKQRSHAILVSMGRLVQGHLDRLERRGNQPYRTAAAAPREAARPVAVKRPETVQCRRRSAADAA